jgi:hypothetical protein
MTNKNTHKVVLTQSGVSAVFRLNDREFELLKKSERPHYPNFLFNFSAFAWADYDLSRSKCGRFHSIFNYHNGDFYWYEE